MHFVLWTPMQRPTKPIKCACGLVMVTIEQNQALYDKYVAEGWSRDKLFQELDKLIDSTPHP